MGCFAVTGGMPWEDSGRLVKRTWIIDDRGCRLSFSDKAHLSTKYGEKDKYSEGETSAIFSIGEVTAAAISDYDVFFPEYCRQLSLAGVKIFFVSASWPIDLAYSWDFVFKSCALLNQSYVAVCNGIGSPPAHFYGNSMIISPRGELIGKLEDKESVLEATFRLSEVKKCRKDISVEYDRRTDLYRLLC
jgi:predicted amidohydrolase